MTELNQSSETPTTKDIAKRIHDRSIDAYNIRQADYRQREELAQRIQSGETTGNDYNDILFALCADLDKYENLRSGVIAISTTLREHPGELICFKSRRIEPVDLSDHPLSDQTIVNFTFAVIEKNPHPIYVTKQETDLVLAIHCHSYFQDLHLSLRELKALNAVDRYTPNHASLGAFNVDTESYEIIIGNLPVARCIENLGFTEHRELRAILELARNGKTQHIDELATFVGLYQSCTWKSLA